jgi:hypothetical protein
MHNNIFEFKTLLYCKYYQILIITFLPITLLRCTFEKHLKRAAYGDAHVVIAVVQTFEQLRIHLMDSLITESASVNINDSY